MCPHCHCCFRWRIDPTPSFPEDQRVWCQSYCDPIPERFSTPGWHEQPPCMASTTLVYLAFGLLLGTYWPPLPRKLFADWPSSHVCRKPRWQIGLFAILATAREVAPQPVVELYLTSRQWRNRLGLLSHIAALVGGRSIRERLLLPPARRHSGMTQALSWLRSSDRRTIRRRVAMAGNPKKHCIFSGLY